MGGFMSLHEMRNEISEARRTLENADEVAQQIAYVLEGRLRQVNGSALASLKKELKDFNANTWTWKEKQ
jgi:hypothetical protein